MTSTGPNRSTYFSTSCITLRTWYCSPATADTPVAPAAPADPSYQAGPYKGALTAPPADAMNKTYPVCTRKLQDNCRNRGGI